MTITVSDETCVLCDDRVADADLEYDSDGEPMHRACRTKATLEDAAATTPDRGKMVQPKLDAPEPAPEPAVRLTRIAQLTAIRDRVIAATGADREIDAAIAVTLGEGPGEGWVIQTHSPCVHNMDAGRWIKGGRIRTPSPYTSSFDAALALIERVLPGASWGVNTAMEGGFAADVPFQKLKDMQPHPVRHRTAPLAILAALLSALIAKEQNNAE